MADERMPEEVIAWMSQKGWSEHHDQWHFERRWDHWHARAALPGAPSWIGNLVKHAESQAWTRSAIQEGEAGNGEDFLFMHRAMIHLILEKFPQHLHLLRGWATVPTDPADAEDPLPGGAADAFDPNMAAAIARIERDHADMADDDAFGLFVQTRERPKPGEPLAKSPEPQAGIHNYLHNRWADNSSDINLGSPLVNLINARFWKLHGWIDHCWWRFRRLKGLDDTAAGYVSKLAFYKNIMGKDHHHHHFEGVMRSMRPAHTTNLFVFDGPPVASAAPLK